MTFVVTVYFKINHLPDISKLGIVELGVDWGFSRAEEGRLDAILHDTVSLAPPSFEFDPDPKLIYFCHRNTVLGSLLIRW